MRDKRARQNKIIKIIKQKRIGSQEELLDKLRKGREKATQATLSRDLRELGITKIPVEGGLYRYQLNYENSLSINLGFEFSHFVTGIDSAQNLVVIHTEPGGAQGVARSIDKANLSYILGTVGGDDTVLVIINKISNTAKTVKHFEDALKGES